jgi:hypothetical protein
MPVLKIYYNSGDRERMCFHLQILHFHSGTLVTAVKTYSLLQVLNFNLQQKPGNFVLSSKVMPFYPN